MLTIKPKIGLVIGKTSNPTYSFTITRVDTKTKRFFGDVKDDGFTYHDSYFDQMKFDGTYDLTEPFILLADPEPTQDKPMTQPAPVPTPWTCYNCGKKCFDKAGRNLLSDNDTRTAWCGDCAEACGKRANILNTKDIAALIAINGICLVGITDAEKASPTLKNNYNLKVEKGQVWRLTYSTGTETIASIGNGYASNGRNKEWGKLTKEGCPEPSRWDKEWRLIKPATTASEPTPVAKAGQTYRRDDGWTIKITKITNSTVEATQIGDYSSWKDGDHHGCFTYLDGGKMPEKWKLVEEKPAEPTKIKMKVGQVWKCGSTSCRITQIRKDNSVDVIRTGNGKDEVINNYGSIHADGTSGFGKSWVLEQDIDYTKTKVEAGQTWTNSTGAVEVKIVGIKDGYALNQHSNAWGKLTPEGYPDGWVNLPHGWYLSKIEPVENPLPAAPPIHLMKVGQVWAYGKMGEEHKIVGFKNNKVNILIGASRKVGEGFGTVKPDGSPGEDWGKIQEDRWHLVREEPIKVKVGQKWRWIGSHEPTLLNQVFTVEELKTTGECKVDSARICIHRDVRDDTVMNAVFANWELVEEAPRSQPKAKPVIGSVWKDRHGIAFRVVAFKEKSKDHYYVELEKGAKDGSWHKPYAWDWTDGKFQLDNGKEWTLEETKTNEAAAGPPVGSIWKVGELLYRVYRFRDGGGRNVDLDCFSGGQWASGSTWLWVNGKFEPLYGKEWIMEEPKKAYPEPKVGQVWRGNGQSFSVKEIRKSTRSDWDKDIFFLDRHNSTVNWPWKDGKFDSGYIWELETDVPATEPQQVLPQVKVGQIWDPGDGIKRRIKEVSQTLAYLEVKNGKDEWWSGGAWYLKEGKWEKPLIGGKNWTLISEKETIPPPPVGSLWSPGDTSQYRVATISPPRGPGEEALVVMDLKLPDGSWEAHQNEWGWKDGKLISSLDWKQVGQAEKKTEEVAVEKQTLKVGQIWKLSSQKYRVRDFDGSSGTVRLDRWISDKNEWVSGSDWDYTKDGKFKGDNWILEEDVKQVELKAGQVWRITKDKYRIHVFEGSPPTKARLDWWNPQTNAFMINQSYHTVKDGILTDIGAEKWILEEDVAAEKPVSEKPSFRQMMGADMVNATYRVAAHQLTKASKQALLSLMEKQGHNSQSIKALSELLDTEFGSALVGMTLGIGLTYIPQVSSSGRAQRLATEFRTGSMATAGNVVADAMTQHFIPAITNALSGIPKEQIRVATSLPALEEQVELHEEIEKEARA